MSCMAKKDKSNLEEQLQREMFTYYKKQNEIISAQESSEKEKLEEETKLVRELHSMGERMKKLKDKDVIEGLYSITIKKWEEDEETPTSRLGYLEIFRSLEAQDWFLKKGIDVKSLGLTESFISSDKYDYFGEYGLKERMRWEKITINIIKKLNEYIDEENKEKYKEMVAKFIQKAREEGLYSVTTAHIKNFAVELGVDITKQVNQLTTAVTTELQKELGSHEVKRKRTLTNSIKIEVFKRDNHTCQECGAGREAKLHVHHIIPVSRGGTDEMSNLVTLCESCNQSIGNRIYKTKTKTSE